MTTIDDCREIDLPKIARPEGNITPVEGERTVPFDVARVYYLYDIVGGADRGGHAHRRLQQLIVAVMGGFTVTLDDGEQRQSIELNRAYKGLYVPRMLWRELTNFTAGAVCVVLASELYEEDDYIRDYDTFAACKAADSK
jgi:hypothetical protein